jgi:Protein of unknown function (DUF1399).
MKLHCNMPLPDIMRSYIVVLRSHRFLQSSCIHSFLDLMASSPESFFVPTLDIDLAWHTHQLMADQYNTECLKYVGRYIDQ